MKKTILALGLAALASHAAEPRIRGKFLYQGQETYTITIDDANRVVTDLPMISSSTGMRSVLVFPDPMSPVAEGQVFRADGNFVFFWTTSAGASVGCSYAIGMELSFDPTYGAARVTMTMPERFGADREGKCYSTGRKTKSYTFRRI